MENNITISTHAYDRARERLGWKSKVLEKMAQKALYEGVKHSDAKGSLMRYLSYLWNRYKHCDNTRIYGEIIFFFCGSKLVTLYRLPNKMCRRLKYQVKND